MAKQKSRRPSYKHVIIHRNDTVSDILYSIREVEGDNVVVYLPDQMKTLSHASNARLLKRELDRGSKNVVFCSPDPAITRELERQGLDVETDSAGMDEADMAKDEERDPFAQFFGESQPHEAEFEARREVNTYAPAKKKPWYAHFWAITGGLLLGVLVALVAVMYYVPQATVTLAFEGEQLKREYKVAFDPSAEKVDNNNLVMPATLKTKQGRVSQTFESSGKAQKDVKTKLQLTVKNERSTEQSLVENTRFKSSQGYVYRTVEGVSVPAGGEVTVAAIATKPGYKYNLSPDARLEIVALGTDRVYGLVKSVERSGSEQGTRYISDKDRSKAQEKLKQMLAQKLSKQITKDKDTIGLLSSAQFFKDVSYKRLPKAGTETESFRPTLEAKLEVLAYDEAALLQMVNERVKQQMPEGQNLSDKVRLTFSEPLADTQLNNGVTVRVFVEYVTHANLDRDQIRSDLTMKSFSQVREYMQQYAKAKEVNVELSPRVWPRMPFFKRNITVQTKGL